jgi:hypothetical protein
LALLALSDQEKLRPVLIGSVSGSKDKEAGEGYQR